VNEQENARRAIDDGAAVVVVIACDGISWLGGHVSKDKFIEALQKILAQQLDEQAYSEQLVGQLREKLQEPGAVQGIIGPHDPIE
jgi:hypothetical protein